MAFCGLFCVLVLVKAHRKLWDTRDYDAAFQNWSMHAAGFRSSLRLRPVQAPQRGTVALLLNGIVRTLGPRPRLRLLMYPQE